MKILAQVAALLLLSGTAQAQEPVNKWADGVSWATAFVNPIHAVYEAIRSEHPWCELGRVGLSAGTTAAIVLPLKHYVISPRPCIGCIPDGFPSGHSAFSMVGSSGWSYGFAFSVGTAGGRVEANRHYKKQVAAGLAIGAAGELTGRLVKCP